jgi:hypothetical protein
MRFIGHAQLATSKPACLVGATGFEPVECAIHRQTRNARVLHCSFNGIFLNRGDIVSNVQAEGTAPFPTTGTPDDDDDRDDEHEGENEAPIGELDDQTEAPEEFEVDDEDELGHPEDDDADETDDA